ncbi:hypothetical protein MHYP_G00063700 [Metynnis hypsauchen]
MLPDSLGLSTEGMLHLYLGFLKGLRSATSCAECEREKQFGEVSRDLKREEEGGSGRGASTFSSYRSPKSHGRYQEGNYQAASCPLKARSKRAPFQMGEQKVKALRRA